MVDAGENLCEVCSPRERERERERDILMFNNNMIISLLPVNSNNNVYLLLIRMASSIWATFPIFYHTPKAVPYHEPSNVAYHYCRFIIGDRPQPWAYGYLYGRTHMCSENTLYKRKCGKKIGNAGG